MEKKGLLYNIHPTGKMFFTLLVAFFCTFVMVAVGVLAAVPFLGSDILKIFSGEFDMTATENLNFTKYLQILSHLGMFIIPSLLLAWWFGKSISSYLFLKTLPDSRILFLAVILVFVSVPLINYVLELNMQLHFPEKLKGVESWMRSSEDAAERVTEAFLAVDTIQALIFNIFVIAFIPAIGEEFMFRGVLMRVFGQWTRNAHLAVWITAIIFSAIHMQFFGFFPRMILGILFGYLVVWTGSIWPAIFAHFVNNAAAVIFFFLHRNEVTDGTFENLGKGSQGLIFAMVSMAFTFLLMWGIKTIGKIQQPRKILLNDNPDIKTD